MVCSGGGFVAAFQLARSSPLDALHERPARGSFDARLRTSVPLFETNTIVGTPVMPNFCGRPRPGGVVVRQVHLVRVESSAAATTALSGNVW